MQQIEWDCTILENQALNDQYFILTLQGETISQTAQPGQFVNLSCQQFLRRPFGIMSVDRNTGTFKIGIQVKGKGTLEFKALKSGAVVSVLGPLGHGFDVAGYRQIITVGGGTGVFHCTLSTNSAGQRGSRLWPSAGIAAPGMPSSSMNCAKSPVRLFSPRTLAAWTLKVMRPWPWITCLPGWIPWKTRWS